MTADEIYNDEKLEHKLVRLELSDVRTRLRDCLETLEYIGNAGIGGERYQSHSSLVQLARKTFEENNED